MSNLTSSSSAELISLFDRLSTFYSLICKETDSAGDLICSRKRGHSSQTTTNSAHFDSLHTIAIAFKTIITKINNSLAIGLDGLVNGTVSLMLSCIEQLIDSQENVAEALPSLFTLIYAIIVITNAVESKLSCSRLCFLIRLLSCVSKGNRCRQLSFVGELCTSIHTSLLSLQPNASIVLHMPCYFTSGEMTITEMQISFQLTLRRILLSLLSRSQNSDSSSMPWLLSIVHFEDDAIDFLSLAEDDENLFDFLNISIQLEPRMTTNSTLFSIEAISLLTSANASYFVVLLVNILKLDLSTLLDLLCGEETCSLEYFLRFLKSHFLSQLDFNRSSQTIKLPVEASIVNSGGSRQGVIVLCEENIIQTSTYSGAITDRTKRILRPEIEEWLPKVGKENGGADVDHDNGEEAVTTTADVASIRELFVNLKQQLSRRYSKGRLSFNPAPLLRSIESFVTNT